MLCAKFFLSNKEIFPHKNKIKILIIFFETIKTIKNASLKNTCSSSIMNNKYNFCIKNWTKKIKQITKKKNTDNYFLKKKLNYYGYFINFILLIISVWKYSLICCAQKFFLSKKEIFPHKKKNKNTDNFFWNY